MKKKFKLFLISFSLVACQDVIDVDLNTAKPKLVVDASLKWAKGTNGAEQTIKLTLTAPFFDTILPPANGAIVTVTNSKNAIFNFIEEENTGIYKTQNFEPVLNETYVLKILYNGENYVASERLMPVTSIDFIEQKNDGGFSGEATEIKAFYKDPVDSDNFYLFEFLVTESDKSTLQVYEDEFTNGNQIFAFYSDEDLETGNQLIVRSSGISKQSFAFLNILLQQSDGNSGDPFQVQPATVRGNCVNQTKPENFPLGYFRVSETDVINYLIN